MYVQFVRHLIDIYLNRDYVSPHRFQKKKMISCKQGRLKCVLAKVKDFNGP